MAAKTKKKKKTIIIIIIDKTRNGENMESLEEAEVVLVQCKNEKKYVKGCGFMSFARSVSIKSLDNCTLVHYITLMLIC